MANDKWATRKRLDAKSKMYGPVIHECRGPNAEQGSPVVWEWHWGTWQGRHYYWAVGDEDFHPAVDYCPYCGIALPELWPEENGWITFINRMHIYNERQDDGGKSTEPIK